MGLFGLSYARRNFAKNKEFAYDTQEEAKPYTGPIRELTRSPLQDYIDNAKEGSIIRLKAGTYKGNVVITKPISLVGVEEGVILDGLGVGSVVTIKVLM